MTNSSHPSLAEISAVFAHLSAGSVVALFAVFGVASFSAQCLQAIYPSELFPTGVRATANGFATVTAAGGGGNDTANLTGSSGADTLTASPTAAAPPSPPPSSGSSPTSPRRRASATSRAAVPCRTPSTRRPGGGSA